MSHYDFFQNRECEYFPCHPGANPESFSCIFCYCPLYALGANCGGNFQYTKEGIKDCTNCLRPHRRENYEAVTKALRQVMELAKKKPEQAENP
ncbi:MAG: cysteine-rich small domain-containing protein [Oscillospiraceae bacterium]|nr:cysteine-rich small domain-containing protein [Oscillospiraceae bacterium]